MVYLEKKITVFLMLNISSVPTEEVSEPGDPVQASLSPDNGGYASSTSSLGEEFYDHLSLVHSHFEAVNMETVKLMQDK